MFRSIILGLSLLLTWTCFAMAQSSWVMPSDSDIHKILAERIDIQKLGVGLVVGAPGNRLFG